MQATAAKRQNMRAGRKYQFPHSKRPLTRAPADVYKAGALGLLKGLDAPRPSRVLQCVFSRLADFEVAGPSRQLLANAARVRAVASQIRIECLSTRRGAQRRQGVDAGGADRADWSYFHARLTALVAGPRWGGGIRRNRGEAVSIGIPCRCVCVAAPSLRLLRERALGRSVTTETRRADGAAARRRALRRGKRRLRMEAASARG